MPHKYTQTYADLRQTHINTRARRERALRARERGFVKKFEFVALLAVRALNEVGGKTPSTNVLMLDRLYCAVLLAQVARLFEVPEYRGAY
jgi:hypothetical protein